MFDPRTTIEIFSVSQVLLIANVLVAGDQYLVARLFGAGDRPPFEI
jgi:hypothetical protein